MEVGYYPVEISGAPMSSDPEIEPCADPPPAARRVASSSSFFPRKTPSATPPFKSLRKPLSSRDLDDMKFRLTTDLEAPSPASELSVDISDEDHLAECIGDSVRQLTAVLDNAAHPEHAILENTPLEKRLRRVVATLKQAQATMSVRVAQLEKMLVTSVLSSGSAVASRRDEDEDMTRWLSTDYALKTQYRGTVEKKSKRASKAHSRRSSADLDEKSMRSSKSSSSQLSTPTKRTDSPEDKPAPSSPGLKRRKRSKALSDTLILNVEFPVSNGPQVLFQLMRSSLWEWDCFYFDEICDGKPLVVLMQYLLDSYGLIKNLNLDLDTIVNYFTAIEGSYINVAYHNSIHATDVVQSMHFFMQCESFGKLFSDEEKLATLVAAAVHDAGHPGNNNIYEVESGSELALTYNDHSVLENFHLATAFRIMQRPENGLFNHFSRSTQKKLREMIISMVLATDMKRHVRIVAKLQALVEMKRSQSKWFESYTKDKESEDRRELLAIGVHTADISSASKKLSQSLEWAHRIHIEFWNQGDRERELELPVNPIMDRNKPNYAKSQMAFITMIVDPLYQVWSQVVPDAKVCLMHQERNMKYWKSRMDTLQAIKDRALIRVPE